MKTGKTTLSDVAAAAGVSVSTASLVLSNSVGASIPLATQTRVREAARSLQYLPPKKRSSAIKSSLPVLILTSDLTNPYYPILVEHLERAAEKYDFQFLCCNTYHQVQRERFLLSQAEKGQFFAVVFLYPPGDPEYAGKINRKLPVVAICDKDAALGIDLIEMNNYQAGCIAAEHLLSCGHDRIAIFSSDPSRSISRSNRVRGATETIAQAGKLSTLFIADRSALRDIPGDNTNYKTGVCLGRDMELPGHYSAIIAVNDMEAMGAMDALANRGVCFPEDMSIIGFDNLLYTGLLRISLTTVDYHMDMLAQAAVALLYRRLHPQAAELLLSATRFKVECPPNLVLRSSTAAYRDKTPS